MSPNRFIQTKEKEKRCRNSHSATSVRTQAIAGPLRERRTLTTKRILITTTAQCHRAALNSLTRTPWIVIQLKNPTSEDLALKLARFAEAQYLSAPNFQALPPMAKGVMQIFNVAPKLCWLHRWPNGKQHHTGRSFRDIDSRAPMRIECWTCPHWLHLCLKHWCFKPHVDSRHLRTWFISVQRRQSFSGRSFRSPHCAMRTMYHPAICWIAPIILPRKKCRRRTNWS